MIQNPRFPHTCRILRYPDTEPMEDQPQVNGVPSSEPEDDPMADETPEPVEEPVQEPVQEPEPVPDEPSDEEESDDEPEPEVAVIYEGVCRSWNRDSTADNGDVHASYRMLALPQRQQDWTDETVPRTGDRIELTRYGYTEYGKVLDVSPSNLGTHLTWKYVRN